MSRALAVAAACSAILAVACGSSTQGTITRPSAQASPSPTPAATLKPALGGLLDRDGPPPGGYLAVMGGFVVNVYWRDLQSQNGGPIADGNAIDQAIADLHRIDPPGRMGLKVRLYAGIYAPDWLKSLGGTPITIRDPTTGASGTIGRFWSNDFGAAYNDLMTKLAAKYDNTPEVREITISRCTTAYAEPFIRDSGDRGTVAALIAAGYTEAADQQCLRDEIVAHEVWSRTRSDLSFNPYQVIEGAKKTDETITDDIMDFCRSTLGQRCVLANNSIRVPLQFPQMYQHMQSLGPPIAFQTAVLSKVGNLGSTLQTAITLGAGSVELPGGFQQLSPSTLAAFSSRLAAQAPA